jgi:hypothetical protein
MHRIAPTSFFCLSRGGKLWLTQSNRAGEKKFGWLDRNLALCFTAADPLFFSTSAVRYELMTGLSTAHLTAYPSSTLRNESSLLGL